MAEQEIQEKIIRIGDILEQIQHLNSLLDFQRENDADPSTIEQYEFIRKEFTEELMALLKEFKINLSSSGLAA